MGYMSSKSKLFIALCFGQVMFRSQRRSKKRGKGRAGRVRGHPVIVIDLVLLFGLIGLTI